MPVPELTTLKSFAARAGWHCGDPQPGPTGPVECGKLSVEIRESATLHLAVTVDAAVAPGTVLETNANVSSASPDAKPGNSIITAATTVMADVGRPGSRAKPK